jgi:hypothetical protein
MPSDDELREQLKKQADAIIEGIMANKKPAGQNSLAELERIAVQAGQGFEEGVLAYLAQDEGQAEVEPVCEACGRRMRSRGKRRKQLVTEAGEIQIERGYYICPQCGKKAFPPG